jgi:hypothetical protein
MIFLAGDTKAYLLWLRLMFAGVSFSVAAFAHFTLLFPSPKKVLAEKERGGLARMKSYSPRKGIFYPYFTDRVLLFY